jgi:hypothetical protein
MDLKRVKTGLLRLKRRCGFVERFDVEDGQDWTGDDAVFVCVIVRDDDLPEGLGRGGHRKRTAMEGRAEAFWRTWFALRAEIPDVVGRVVGPNIITYVSMRALSEQPTEYGAAA